MIFLVIYCITLTRMSFCQGSNEYVALMTSPQVWSAGLLAKPFFVILL
jgi:hypothetical protein